MGQKVSPIGFRTGVTIGWKSRWFAPKSNYGEFLVEDELVRRYIERTLNRQPPYAAISSVEIERTREEVKVSLRTARPGLVIGPKGAEVERLKNDLEELTDRRVNINIIEVKNPDLDAKLLAEGIAEQLRRRASFRRTVKQRADAAMQAGAKGVKIQISGRLGGADMSRTEQVIQGSIPLHTLEADVDYGMVHCFTTYGAIGVKVWIYRGMFGEEPTEEDQAAEAAKARARRRRERRVTSPRRSDRGGQAPRGAPPAEKPVAAASPEKSGTADKPEPAKKADAPAQEPEAKKSQAPSAEAEKPEASGESKSE
jgi:small subunit ribosomal protein S3